MWRTAIVILGLVVVGAPATQTGGRHARFDYLAPGERAALRETVPVNVVFVGYDAPLIDRGSFASALPATYDPVVRSRLWYGVVERLGIHYEYEYNVTFTDAAWENAFFGALSGLAQPAARTLFQDAYNAQQRNAVTVGQNHFIDAPSVEQWLIDHAPRGVDTRRNTIYFINWWGRSDFKFHVYTKFGEPDPDTGFDFGANRHSRKLIAWGGSTPEDEESGLGARGERRVWFFDLSAGPESWTGNWNVDAADLDGDGVADYRLPPVWEYLTPGGYRAASALTGDLARMTRFVAINLLFTSSPLYPPAIAAARLPASIHLDVNTYEGWRGMDASRRFSSPALLVDELRELHPLIAGTGQQDLPLTRDALNCYQLWLNSVGCDASRPQYPGFANLFLYNALHLNETRDSTGDYQAMLFDYATEDNRDSGFLGFADDNWIDGTQSGVFNFVSPAIVSLGYGLTTTQIHETGHHIGMSHPHDGWDSELQLDYGPEGSLYFAWAGDEANSIMSYIDVNWDFGQFDRDNFRRAQAAAYITNANAIAADVLASPDASKGGADLTAADQDIGFAEQAFAAHDYTSAMEHARAAYLAVRRAAGKTGTAVVVSSNGWTVQPSVRGRSQVDRSYSHVDRYGPGTKRSEE